MTYPRKLTFEEQPKYEYLRELMKGEMEKEKYTMDYQYDWSDK